MLPILLILRQTLNLNVLYLSILLSPALTNLEYLSFSHLSIYYLFLVLHSKSALLPTSFSDRTLSVFPFIYVVYA